MLFLWSFWLFALSLFWEWTKLCVLNFRFCFFCLEQTSLEPSASSVLKRANLLTLTKNISDKDRNVSTKIIASAYKNDSGQVQVSGQKIWSQSGYFKNQPTNCSMEKVNYPENSIFYISQGYSTIQNIKKMYYADDFLIDQNIEASNPPENIETHVCKDREVKLFGPNYDLSIEEFSGLCKTVGFIVVRGDDDELFFNCGFGAEKSKILYSHYRRRTRNSFGVTMFNPHRQMIESWEVESVQLELFYFLPSITDRSEEIDKYMDNVSLSQLT